MRKILLFIITIICMLILCSSLSLGEQKGRTVRVAFPIQAGLSEIDEYGNYTGYTYEYLRKICQHTGWKLEFVTDNGIAGNKDEKLLALMGMLENGEVDLMGALLKNEETKKLYAFPENSYGTSYTTLHALEENTKINENNLNTLKQVRIAVLKKANVRNSKLRIFCELNNINTELVECNSMGEQFDKLRTGEADLMVGADLVQVPGTRIVANFGGDPYYLVGAKENEQLIAELDRAIEEINETNPYFSQELYEKYFNYTSEDIILSQDEKNYILDKKAVKALIVADVPPLQYLDSNGSPAGITVGYLNEIAEITGLDFEIFFKDQKNSLEAALESKEYDIIMGVPDSYGIADQYSLVLTSPYIYTETALFAKRTMSAADLSNKTVAIPIDGRILDIIPKENIRYFANLEECIKAVNSGSVDYGYGSNFSVSYYLTQNVYANLITMPMPEETQNFCFGILDSKDSRLTSILNKFIRSNDGDLVNSLLLEELTHGEREFSLIESITLRPVESISFAVLICLLVVIVIAVIFYYRHRQKEMEDEKKKNQLLQSALEDAQFASKAKGDFLSKMSHEIRTPLNGMRGMLDLAMKCSENQRVNDYLDKASISSKHLSALINDILDMSKIESGKLTLKKEIISKYDIEKYIDAVIAPLALDKGLEFRNKYIADGVGQEQKTMYIYCDGGRLKQILINILSNAVKYTEAGGTVDFEMRSNILDDRIVREEFIVKDSGVGMSAEFLENAFDPFEQAETSSASTGTGLGLPITKNLIDLMGGQISIESALGQGTTVTMSIDFEYAFAEDLKEFKETKKRGSHDFKSLDFSKYRVLIVEDNAINLEIIINIMEEFGFQVEYAVNGLEAVELFQKSIEGYYSLILMDIMMPVMDGIEAAQKIRKLERLDAKMINIVAMTANAFAEDIHKTMESGMNHHLSKPFDLQDLKDVLEDIFINKKKD